jgi:hypothetical protein
MSVCELKREECSRENIIGAVGLITWQLLGAQQLAQEQGSTPEVERGIRELQGRAALLVLIGCYSGGLPQRTGQRRYSRLFYKAEICIDRASRAELTGHLDVAQILYARAAELRAQSLAVLHEMRD